jgi:hypothetical protein
MGEALAGEGEMEGEVDKGKKDLGGMKLRGMINGSLLKLYRDNQPPIT